MTYWFKPKTYSYGNVPAAWQGWLVTLGYAAFVVAMVVATKLELISAVWCLAIVFAVTGAFPWLIRAKTDGEWRWRWGQNQ